MPASVDARTATGIRAAPAFPGRDGAGGPAGTPAADPHVRPHSPAAHADGQGPGTSCVPAARRATGTQSHPRTALLHAEPSAGGLAEPRAAQPRRHLEDVPAAGSHPAVELARA